MNWRRGDIVACAIPGDFGGKPRPALVVQSDLVNPTHATVAVCPLTTHFEDAERFRIPVRAGQRSGLRADSQVMVDKLMTVRSGRIGGRIGSLDESEIAAVDEALVHWLGLHRG
ncbi:MAG: type II toxin-antitoxin system PemK/MazF family toxin [Opitutae bacterium]|nr:type II toxin-antitoxin system PemK/MazF family toxin [Opitutae bacterium]